MCRGTCEGVDDARGKGVAVVAHDALEVPSGVAVVEHHGQLQLLCQPQLFTRPRSGFSSGFLVKVFETFHGVRSKASLGSVYRRAAAHLSNLRAATSVYLNTRVQVLRLWNTTGSCSFFASPSCTPARVLMIEVPPY